MGSSNVRSQAAEVSLSKCEATLGATTLSVVEGDISQATVAAIVSCSNATLTLNVGETHDVLARAGVRITVECIAYVNSHGPLTPGEVVVTSHGDLQCDYVLHVIAPVYVNGKRGELEVLKKAVRNVLETAEKLGCRSVAMPGIGTFPYSYPKSECARTMLECILSFVMESPRCLLDIRLVSKDRAMVRCFQKAFGPLNCVNSLENEQ